MDDQSNSDKPPLRALFGDLKRELATLCQQEIALAKKEAAENFKETLRNSSYVIGGAAVALLALAVLLVGFGFALGHLFIINGSALTIGIFFGMAIVALVTGAVAGGLIAKGMHTLQNGPLTPEHTIESLKEDGRWMKDKLQHTTS